MIQEKVKQIIQKYHLVKPNDKIILGLSGGHDSVALLDILFKMKKEMRFDLILVHVNYRFRGKDSDGDERFVRKLAKKYHLKIRVKKTKTTDLPPSTNLEDFFRRVRYEFFEEVRKKERAQKIATAHTLDDQTETIVMFFLRGSGPAGLSGMEYKKEKIIRPLLGTSRKEISQYLKENKLRWRRDVTNEDITFTRNKIRKKLLPFLEKEFNPNLKNTLKMTALIMREYDEAVNLILKEIFEKIARIDKKGKLFVSLKKFQNLSPLFKRLLILKIFSEYGMKKKKISFVFLEDVLRMIEGGRTGSKKIVYNLLMSKKRDKIIITRY